MQLPAYMEENHLDDDAFATLIGKSRVTVSRYRRGLETPSNDTIRQIVEITSGKVTANDLLGIVDQDAAS